MTLRDEIDSAVETGAAIRKVHKFIREHPGERIDVLPMTVEEKSMLVTFLKGTGGGKGALGKLAQRLS